MAHVLFASCRNCCSFAQFLRRTPLASFAMFCRCSKFATVSCLPTLQSRSTSVFQRNHLSSSSKFKRWHSFVDIENSLGCVRKFSSSKIIYTDSERDKESAVTVNSGDNGDNRDSSTELDDTMSSHSADGSITDCHFDAGSPNKAQPLSDADVDKEMLRYDYEEFELIPDEEVSIVQPVKKSVPVELKSK